MKIKRLFFDIETSPNIGFFWQSGYKLNIDYDTIIKERAIICICYKWQGEKKTYSLQWNENQCDKQMLIDFIKVMNEADEAIGHNGDNFDLKWIRTRCLFHRIECFPKYVTLDTLKKSRSFLRLNSNRLDYIGKFLGLDGKKDTGGFGLWKDICLNNSTSAMKKMVDYCKRDVVLLEQIFTEINPYINHNTHHGVLNGEYSYSCPNCGSNESKANVKRTTAAGVVRRQMVCHGCHKNFTISNKAYLQKLDDQSGWNKNIS
jgi:DNA polymerase elongation subunit (family B)